MAVLLTGANSVEYGPVRIVEDISNQSVIHPYSIFKFFSREVCVAKFLSEFGLK